MKRHFAGVDRHSHRRIDVHLCERLDFVPPHVDPTLDRYDVLHFVRGDVLVEIAPIEARGASQ